MFAKKIIIIIFALGAFSAFAANSPNIGYLYPAGGEQGTVVKVVAGGQFLRNPEEAIVSGKGVSAKIVKYFKTRPFIYREEREVLVEQMRKVRNKRLTELGLPVPPDPPPKKKKPAKTEINYERQRLPEHPLTLDFDSKTLWELAHVRQYFFTRVWHQQRNRQLLDLVLLEVTIAPDAAPGKRDIRLKTKSGLTNPVIFQVGTLPETVELEPNDQLAYPVFPRLKKQPPPAPPITLPAVINGQIMPGDVDRFRFKAEAGQQLVMAVYARSLNPYLADAVPGWFQAVLSIYDEKGRELAFADDYRFNPDPVMLFKVPRSSEYELVISDSIYRGREDFVYRIEIGELPFITSIFPLGGRSGRRTIVAVDGWNLPRKQLSLNTAPGGSDVRQVVIKKGKLISNPVFYAVDDLPEKSEIEPNNSAKQAETVKLSVTVNGTIGHPGDIDVFKFQGRAGDEIIAEIYARRLGSSLDSILRLTDASGKVLQWNDDFVRKDKYLHVDASGLITHHADSYLTAKLPADGSYCIIVSDASGHGGKAYGYRLRLSPPKPDFALRMVPSTLTFRIRGVSVPVCVYALRKDGFEGDIKVILREPASGWELEGGRIPAGQEYAWMTLRASTEKYDAPVSLQFEGRALVSGKTVIRPVIPADDVMQAFLYRHLAPADEFLTAVSNNNWTQPLIKLKNSTPVKVPLGGSVVLHIAAKLPDAFLKNIRLQLKDPPKGISIKSFSPIRKGLDIVLQADKTAPVGLVQNLIIEMERENVKAKGKARGGTKWRSIGFLPAIPISIVEKL